MSSNGHETFIRGSRSSERLMGILCIDLDPVSRDSLENLVAQTPGAHVVDNVDRHISPREVKRLLEQFVTKICVIDFDDGDESAFPEVLVFHERNIVHHVLGRVRCCGPKCFGRRCYFRVRSASQACCGAASPCLVPPFTAEGANSRSASARMRFELAIASMDRMTRLRPSARRSDMASK